MVAEDRGIKFSEPMEWPAVLPTRARSHGRAGGNCDLRLAPQPRAVSTTPLLTGLALRADRKIAES